MNINLKTQNFNWLVAAAVVLLVVVGLAQNWWGSSETRPPQRTGDTYAHTPSATEAWAANSLVPESRLIPEPTVKLSPAPPLPDENKITEFRPLPQTNQLGSQHDLPTLEVETAPVDDKPAMRFAPLPKIKSIVTRDLPPINDVVTHALPAFPAPPTRDAQASHLETIPAESKKIEAASSDGKPTMQFAPLPQMKGIVTHALPNLPDEARVREQAPQKAAESVRKDKGRKIRSLPRLKDIKLKDIPLQ